MFEMQKLPRDLSGWEPYISATMMNFHYNKHYKGYCDKLNELVVGKDYAEMSLVKVVRQSYKNLPQDVAIYNNAAQMWNHEFFWYSLTLGESAVAEIRKVVKDNFGDMQKFKQRFRQEAMAQFGSGWCWLVKRAGKAEIVKTANADTPIVDERSVPLFCVDVWEHAYYLDYQNRRGDFVDAVLNNVL